MDTKPFRMPALCKPILIGLSFIMVWASSNHLATFCVGLPQAPFLPAAGFAFALLLGCGLRYTPLLLLAPLENLIFPYGRYAPNITTSLVYACEYAISFGLAAWLLMRCRKYPFQFRTLNDTIWFVCCSLLAPLLLTIVRILGNMASGGKDLALPPGLLAEFMQVWGGHIAAIFTVTPFLLFYVIPHLRFLSPEWAPETWLPVDRRRLLWRLVGLCILVGLLFWFALEVKLQHGMEISFLCFLPVIWIASRSGLRTTAALLFGTNSLLLILESVFENMGQAMSLVDFRILVVAYSVTVLLLGAYVTENQRSQEELKKSETKYRNLFEHVPVGVYQSNAEGGILIANRALADMLGYDSVDQLRQCAKLADFYSSPSQRQQWIAKLEREGIIQGEVSKKRKDGSLLLALEYCRVVKDAQRQGLYYDGMLLDITARKQAEEALRESQARLEQAQRVAQLGNWELDYRSWQMRCSEEMCRLCGMSHDEAELSLEQFLERVHPDDWTSVGEAFEQAPSQGKLNYLDYRILPPNQTERYVRQSAEAVRGSDGVALGLIGTLQDITEYKRLEEQLQQAQKMESIGRLAGGVAHDFNNLLTVINGNCEMMIEDLAPGDPLRNEVDEVLKAGQRAAGLTQQLLAFSRRQVLQPRVVELNGIVSDAEKMLKRLIGEDVELITHLEANLTPVEANLTPVRVDPGQISQVILNLAVNARDAMPNGGKLILETESVRLGPDYAAQHPGVAVGEYVMLSVSDTGHGMNEETKEHLFEPFYTTKGLGQGTGLGLSTVFGIVKQSGGHLTVYSELGRGTMFRIYLPQAEAEKAVKGPDTATITDLRGTETVLVVEDQDEVRRLIKDVLKSHGYRVLDAGNGQDAVALSAEYLKRIDLVITDLVMPGMGGRALAEQLQVRRPELAVLYISGYTQNMIAHKGVLDAGVNYLQKPFSQTALLTKVRDVLQTG